ncbi:MAG: DUF5317 domain-containing protein [Microthrixaceae bacterium]|nr:DUF5317 domain-containing protein [Microthrixaceae bacterium]
MALLPTLVALAVGVGLGLRWGGSFHNITQWRPVFPLIGAGGLTLMILTDVVGIRGTPAVLLRLLALGLIVAFAVLNIHTGGMVLVAAGFGLDLLVTLINWGMPVSVGAMVASGMAHDRAAAEAMTLSGGREVADGAWLGFLGDVIPLPWGQVVSIGDLLWLSGLTLVTASVMRRYQVRGARARAGTRRVPSARRGNNTYSQSLSVLGRGPAPRKGPGLHPSRLGDRRPGRPTR